MRRDLLGCLSPYGLGLRCCPCNVLTFRVFRLARFQGRLTANLSARSCPCTPPHRVPPLPSPSPCEPCLVRWSIRSAVLRTSSALRRIRACLATGSTFVPVGCARWLTSLPEVFFPLALQTLTRSREPARVCATVWQIRCAWVQTRFPFRVRSACLARFRAGSRCATSSWPGLFHPGTAYGECPLELVLAQNRACCEAPDIAVMRAATGLSTALSFFSLASVRRHAVLQAWHICFRRTAAFAARTVC